jgi:signal peptidase II
VRLAGHVIDFIDMGLGGFRWFTYNVADACVVVGVIMMLAREVLFRPRGPDAGGPGEKDAPGLPRQ